MNKKLEEIPYINLSAQWEEEKKDLLPIIEKILSSGQYVGGKEIEKFENEITKHTSTKYAVALNSGTDALTLALSLSNVKRGDEVITTPNSFIASTGAITHLGAVPVFVDVDSDMNVNVNKIEEVITSKTKVIMPVHLTGRVCKMDKIIDIANKYKLLIVEDAAQSIKSKYRNNFAGSFGHVGCFSTHPLKNLNACGDSGFITTNSEEVYLKALSLRNHGLINRDHVENFGYVSRMDTLQAGILNYRLKKVDEIIKKRRNNAKIYLENLNNNKILLPYESDQEFNTYHTFVIQYSRRNELQNHLKKNNIATAIHYPIPIHLQPASKIFGHKIGDFPETERQSNEILTIPIHQFLTNNQLEKIILTINKFVK